MSTKPPLKYDVFVAPELPFVVPPPLRVANSDPAAWDPKTSTLIYGACDAVLVDALLTIREATALADWIELHDRRLTTIYITHGHGDHFLGLSVLLDRFPGANIVATSGTVEQMRKSVTSRIPATQVNRSARRSSTSAETCTRPVARGYKTVSLQTWASSGAIVSGMPI